MKGSSQNKTGGENDQHQLEAGDEGVQITQRIAKPTQPTPQTLNGQLKSSKIPNSKQVLSMRYSIG